MTGSGWCVDDSSRMMCCANAQAAMALATWMRDFSKLVLWRGLQALELKE